MNCQDHLYRNADPRQVTRRWFLEQCGVGLGCHGAGPIARRRGLARPTPATRRPSIRWRRRAPHYAPKAKRVLFLFMAGAPSHLELFDNKPQLAKFDGTLPPPGADQGLSRGVHQAQLEAARPQVQVRPARPERHRALRALAAPGDGGRRHRGRQGDGHRRVQPRAGPDHDEHRLADLRPAEHRAPGSPTAWAASRRTCPASSSSAPGNKGPSGGNSNWGSGFLPTVYQGVQFRTSGDPVLYLSNPRGVDADLQRDSPRRRPQAQPDAARSQSATPRSPRGSTPSRWPSACSSRRPT